MLAKIAVGEGGVSTFPTEFMERRQGRIVDGFPLGGEERESGSIRYHLWSRAENVDSAERRAVKSKTMTRTASTPTVVNGNFLTVRPSVSRSWETAARRLWKALGSER